MYQLWGGGAPFAPTADPDVLLDAAGATVTLCGNTRQILREIRTNERWRAIDAKVAYVSCTDEPSWADECLRKFTLGPARGDGGGGDGAGSAATTLKECGDYEEIYKSNKKTHFTRLQKKTGVAFEDMIFFDNEKHNCTSVSQLGVVCVHCRGGLSPSVWQQGIEKFTKSKGEAQ
jgi:magnesium-dependent phosphatase 1